MYSVILMAAMTASTAEAPAFHWQKSHGCTGGMYLHGAGYGSCMGCWGSGCCGGCYGCWGSCSGGYGGGYSCCGCQGSWYGGCYGCMGCYGVYDGGWGGYGGWYGYGAPATYPANNPPSINPNAPPPPAGTAPPAGTNPPAGTKPAGTSAKVIIEKPTDATIFVDGRQVNSEGTRQVFATPALDPAQAYFYTVRVDVVRDGKPVSETRRVVVRAGETATETFAAPTIATASK